MSKCTFTHESTLTTITLTTEHVGLVHILEDFEQFLRGAGYYFNGHLEIVEEDDILPEETT